jgi:hypothetical protein
MFQRRAAFDLGDVMPEADLSQKPAVSHPGLAAMSPTSADSEPSGVLRCKAKGLPEIQVLGYCTGFKGRDPA